MKLFLILAPADIYPATKIMESISGKIHVIHFNNTYVPIEIYGDTVTYESRSITPVNVKNIVSIYNYRKELKLMTELYSAQVKEVYFFSRFEDLVVPRLMKLWKVRFVFVDHYDYEKAVEMSCKPRYLREWALRLITGNKEVYSRKEIESFELNILHSFSERLNFDKTSFLIKPIQANYTEKNQVLFLVGVANECFTDAREYIGVLLSEMRYWKNEGFKVILKAHPRTGTYSEIEAFADSYFESQCPIELLDLTMCHSFVGVETSALRTLKYIYPDINIVSLLSKFKSSNTSDYIEYLR